jgi:hypothetical protein
MYDSGGGGRTQGGGGGARDNRAKIAIEMPVHAMGRFMQGATRAGTGAGRQMAQDYGSAGPGGDSLPMHALPPAPPGMGGLPNPGAGLPNPIPGQVDALQGLADRARPITGAIRQAPRNALDDLLEAQERAVSNPITQGPISGIRRLLGR